jgi:hypothetical protein
MKFAEQIADTGTYYNKQQERTSDSTHETADTKAESLPATIGQQRAENKQLETERREDQQIGDRKGRQKPSREETAKGDKKIEDRPAPAPPRINAITPVGPPTPVVI